MTRGELKSMAKEQLRGKWLLAIITVLIAELIISGSVLDFNLNVDFGQENYAGYWTFRETMDIIAVLFGGVISVGLSKFLLNMARNKEARLENLFSSFNIYLKTVGLYLLIMLIVMVGMILLIVPGIIAAIAFSQAYYILAEDSSKSITQCLSESNEMMKGYKVDYFILTLSFFGWWILVTFTLGIGALWLLPYQKLTEANFYLDIKNN